MVVVAAILGGIIGAVLTVAGTIAVRGDYHLRMPRALDPEYRHHEVVSCGLLAAIMLKSGSIGAAVGAFLGFLVHRLAF